MAYNFFYERAIVINNIYHAAYKKQFAKQKLDKI